MEHENAVVLRLFVLRYTLEEFFCDCNFAHVLLKHFSSSPFAVTPTNTSSPLDGSIVSGGHLRQELPNQCSGVLVDGTLLPLTFERPKLWTCNGKVDDESDEPIDNHLRVIPQAMGLARG